MKLTEDTGKYEQGDLDSVQWISTKTLLLNHK